MLGEADAVTLAVPERLLEPVWLREPDGLAVSDCDAELEALGDKDIDWVSLGT